MIRKNTYIQLCCCIIFLSILGCKQTPIQRASLQDVLQDLLTTKEPEPVVKTVPQRAVQEQAPPKPYRSPDIWQHIAQNLRFEQTPHQRVKTRVEWYLSQPEYLLTVNQRAKPYLYHIVKKIEQRGLPLDLALLPFVESDFRPQAVSKQSAVGIWQLVDATAYHFGLQSNDWYDGRRDVLASTDAALSYLAYLHKTFDGNWLHAIAAYNTGEGRVKAAIKRNRSAGKSTHYWHLKLPKETADYIPKLLALSYLLKHPETGFKRPELANQASTTILDVGQAFNFGVLSQLLNIDKQQLHHLNSGYLRHQTPEQGPYKVLVPLTDQALMQSPFYREQFSKSYQVKLNDTLYGIARQFGTSVKAIKQLNNKQNNLIRVGETLLINQANINRSLTVNYQISPYLEQLATPKQSTIEHHHTIIAGDSLWDLSQHYQVPLKDLLDWNNLQSASILSPGKVLILHLPTKVKAQPKHQVTTPSYLDVLEEAIQLKEVPSPAEPSLPPD
ncbi:lytic transglycosylase [Pseudoalteromonas luteoviolacea]|uniref:Lytic transglycosylase n=1 Tax=Pseudoalteromonas luteoviolacea TaxID=43657 RepID=A0A0C1MT30_9GAMM|nr:transglycosylase SLT domain-containing protein [Pseudoalteromonas luteoviolacea]KID57998.1 lytic transglycosylase [Pseudoalteromonas luteoviolacea]